LESLRFGSVRDITMKIERNVKMDELLKALAGTPELGDDLRPFEEILVELFQSIGGGRVKASQLLDYREYFAVKVTARRDDGSPVGGAGDQVSTGEAIGIGAAVMMVVLQAWEVSSATLRKRKEDRPMRLLFLDEATRLSARSLSVLFDLCRQLELQLLIAAPDVALVEGGKRYVLARSATQVDIIGREVVARGVGS
jgi:chromosome partition protein MukB